MKTLLLGVTGLCAGGAAYYMSDGPDFDRIVKKSPAQVYAAFSRLADQGTITPPNQSDPGPRVSFKVDKVDGQSIHYEIQFDQRPVVEADLTFAAAGEDGRQTRMTAELDVDAFELGSAFQTEAGVALSLVPDRYIDTQFARFMDHMVDDIEAGRPLPPLAMRQTGIRLARPEPQSRSDRRRRAASAQQAASRPRVDPRPMIDPDRAARNYRDGRAADGTLVR
jgi:hypothetical protein